MSLPSGHQAADAKHLSVSGQAVSNLHSVLR